MSIVPLSTSQEVLLDIANRDAVEYRYSRYKRYDLGICNSHNSFQAVIDDGLTKIDVAYL
jgi:hypothetical protein